MRHEELADLVTHAMQSQRLPRHRVDRLRGGLGYAGRCELCQGTILSTQLSAAVQTEGERHVFHIECFHAWQRAVGEG